MCSSGVGSSSSAAPDTLTLAKLSTLEKALRYSQSKAAKWQAKALSVQIEKLGVLPTVVRSSDRFNLSEAANKNGDSMRKVWGDLKAVGDEVGKAITFPKVVDLSLPEVPVRQQHLSQQVGATIVCWGLFLQR